jgi:YVTN family beta-propeller protein
MFLCLRVFSAALVAAAMLSACGGGTLAPKPTTRPAHIYVTNHGNNIVTTYNADGSRSTPTITAGLDGPFGVAVDAAGKIYVANFNNTVTTYHADGTQTTPTITAEPIDIPQGIAVDLAGKIYVANYYRGTVTTYNANGAAGTPTITGLFAPGGVAVDASGKIYVANFGNSSVTTYHADGTPSTPTMRTTSVTT